MMDKEANKRENVNNLKINLKALAIARNTKNSFILNSTPNPLLPFYLHQLTIIIYLLLLTFLSILNSIFIFPPPYARPFYGIPDFTK